MVLLTFISVNLYVWRINFLVVYPVVSNYGAKLMDLQIFENFSFYLINSKRIWESPLWQIKPGSTLLLNALHTKTNNGRESVTLWEDWPVRISFKVCRVKRTLNGNGTLNKKRRGPSLHWRTNFNKEKQTQNFLGNSILYGFHFMYLEFRCRFIYKLRCIVDIYGNGSSGSSYVFYDGSRVRRRKQGSYEGLLLMVRQLG